MKLSVVIPCYNGADTIGIQLEALSRQEWSQEWEVIVADNGSTDGTREVIESYVGRVPNLRVVDASARRGRSFARNTGVEHAVGESIAFCDADDEIGEDWVRAIGEALEVYDFVASRRDEEKLNEAPHQRYLANPSNDGLQCLPYPPYMPFASTNGLGIKRHLHDQVGGFDETFVRSQDTDYCLRIQKAGVTLHFVPEAVIYYRRRGNVRGVMAQGYAWGYYAVLIYKRHSPPDMRVSGGWWQNIRSLLKLFRRPPIRSGPRGKMRWMWFLSWHVGMLVGGLRHGIEPPFLDPKRARQQPAASESTISKP